MIKGRLFTGEITAPYLLQTQIRDCSNACCRYQLCGNPLAGVGEDAAFVTQGARFTGDTAGSKNIFRNILGEVQEVAKAVSLFAFS